MWITLASGMLFIAIGMSIVLVSRQWVLAVWSFGIGIALIIFWVAIKLDDRRIMRRLQKFRKEFEQCQLEQRQQQKNSS
jgi:hypothetical protein